MVKKCKCGKYASCNIPGETTPKWCKTCPDKPPNAINVITKKCGCEKQRVPNFNMPGETIRLYCVSCKPEGAINVKAKMCECGKSQPRFNLLHSYQKIFQHLF
jgi:hypothetical protein